MQSADGSPPPSADADRKGKRKAEDNDDDDDPIPTERLNAEDESIETPQEPAEDVDPDEDILLATIPAANIVGLQHYRGVATSSSKAQLPPTRSIR